ncbi:MAG: GNAT family N-acetyltransferase [Brachybacterium sp.]|uniref:GNAT family N-acetyltransferase n=1 Tax=unclassified Brachybacterium TaxID=2623841 RepID=UPI003F932F29
MATTLTIPTPDLLEHAIGTLRTWQREDGPFHLHPGDLGWHHLRGAEAATAHLRLWHREDRLVALGLLDGPDLVRTAVDPALAADEELARSMAEALARPEHAVLPEGQAFVEAHSAHGLRTELLRRGWSEGEPWVPLRRGLAAPVEEPGIVIEQVGADTIAEYTAVHRSAFDSPGVTDERFRIMTTSPAYRDAVSLLGRDCDSTAVAVVTVWSAGVGRPGLIEPMGVHADHRGRGHGRAICRAAAAQLRDLGASSALVCTPRSQAGAVETYVAAGFAQRAEVPDLQRCAVT